jgi:hypothetical protein
MSFEIAAREAPPGSHQQHCIVSATAGPRATLCETVTLRRSALEAIKVFLVFLSVFVSSWLALRNQYH